MSARDRSTFGGVHRPVPRNTRAQSARQAADLASYDNAPATGCGAAFLLLLTILATILGAVLA
ncbi:hypothetical protein ACFVTT_35440 [Streptomyces niveus]|uniref:hypothetical protein n=1 Tax=Streptomyces niveus TaxID=193462 RepID=UPI0034296B8E